MADQNPLVNPPKEGSGKGLDFVQDPEAGKRGKGKDFSAVSREQPTGKPEDRVNKDSVPEGGTLAPVAKKDPKLAPDNGGSTQLREAGGKGNKPFKLKG